MRIRLPRGRSLEGPILAGRKMGLATVRLNGQPFATVPLFAGRTVEKPGLIDKLLGNPLWIAGLLLLALFAIIASLLLVRRRRERKARKRLQRVLRTRR
nr:hypothetical protein [Solirubrobacterales bacterium]